MAKVTATKTETVYTLQLSEREANALYEALINVDFTQGEGATLEALYNELDEAGVRAWNLYSDIKDGHVVIESEDAE